MEMAFTLMEHLETVVSVHRFTLQKLCSGPYKQIVLLLDVVNVATKFFFTSTTSSLVMDFCIDRAQKRR